MRGPPPSPWSIHGDAPDLYLNNRTIRMPPRARKMMGCGDDEVETRDYRHTRAMPFSIEAM